MRIRTIVLSALTVTALVGGVWYSSLDQETRGLLKALPTNAEVLSWDQSGRYNALAISSAFASR